MTEEDIETMTEDEARKMFNAFQAPKLNELRKRVPKMRTSELLGFLMNPEALRKILDGDFDVIGPDFKSEELMIIAAAGLSLSDEIDRRIPVPG